MIRDVLKVGLGCLFALAVAATVQAFYPEISAAAKSDRGVTVFFRHGGSMYLAGCDIKNFPKSIGYEERVAGSVKNRMASFCGGGSETLERLDLNEVVGLCQGRCPGR